MTTGGSLDVVATVWNWVEQYSGALTVVLALIAIGPGYLAIRSAKRDSIDRTRPVIVVELQRHHEAPMTLMLLVRNAGPSLARSVSITFDPPLATEVTPTSRYAAYASRMFAAPIATLAPGQSITNPWFAAHDKGVPELCTVTARYTDAHERPYVDKYIVDMSPYQASLFIAAEDSVRGRLTTLAQQAKKQTAALEEIAASRREPEE
jgi:hypothetical protein